MSRKTVRWRKLARQVGEERLDLLEPHRATGRARFRCVELDDITLEGAFGKVCTRPMGDEKLNRIRRVLADATKPTSKKRGW